jgi:hypothetical protein
MFFKCVFCLLVSSELGLYDIFMLKPEREC